MKSMSGIDVVTRLASDHQTGKVAVDRFISRRYNRLLAAVTSRNKWLRAAVANSYNLLAEVIGYRYCFCLLRNELPLNRILILFQQLPTASGGGFFLRLVFDIETAGYIFLRNVGYHPNYTSILFK
jgi:hypothetical protein